MSQSHPAIKKILSLNPNNLALLYLHLVHQDSIRMTVFIIAKDAKKEPIKAVFFQDLAFLVSPKQITLCISIKIPPSMLTLFAKFIVLTTFISKPILFN
jgi:hypothetical protein